MHGKLRKGLRRLLQRPRVSKVQRSGIAAHSHAASPLHRISRRRLYLQQQQQSQHTRHIQTRYQTRSVTLASIRKLVQRSDTPVAGLLGGQAMSSSRLTSPTTSRQSQQQQQGSVAVANNNNTTTTTAAATTATTTATSPATANTAAMSNSTTSSATAAAQAQAQQKQQQQTNSSPLYSFNAAGFPQNYAPNSYFAYVAEVRRRLGKDDAAISSGFLHEPIDDDWDTTSATKQNAANAARR